MSDLDGVRETIETLRDGFESLFVRGTSTSSPQDRKSLSRRAETWERAGAIHVAARVRDALASVDADSREAEAKLLGAYTSLHTFERLLSLDVARDAWKRVLDQQAGESPAPARAEPITGAPPVLADERGMSTLLADLAKVAEDLVRTGLTSATAATRTKLDASFKEASRRKLLRIAASLRYVNEEVGRFLADDGTFAARRYAFFLHRSWLLAHGARRALEKGDSRLVMTLVAGTGAAPLPAGNLEVVALGIAKRSLANACTFDVRLRVLRADDAALLGQSLVFSLVFARKTSVPAEAYLLLPQPQKYLPRILHEHAVLRITDATLVAGTPTRLLLTPKSTVTQGDRFTAWTEHYTWDASRAHARAASHTPSPLDLAAEMQEEMIARDWELTRLPARCTPEKHVFELRAGALTVDATVPAEAKELLASLEATTKKQKKQEPRPPIFGTVHYELGRLVFLPLSLLHRDGPEHITLSNEPIDLTKLLGSLDLK